MPLAFPAFLHAASVAMHQRGAFDAWLGIGGRPTLQVSRFEHDTRTPIPFCSIVPAHAVQENRIGETYTSLNGAQDTRGNVVDMARALLVLEGYPYEPSVTSQGLVWYAANPQDASAHALASGIARAAKWIDAMGWDRATPYTDGFLWKASNVAAFGQKAL